jgi:HNH endonuclease
MAKHGEPLRFLEKALLYQGDECLEWPYARSEGYGRVYRAGVMMFVHRVVCEATNGPPPAGYDAAHSCGNRGCCSPQHISWKTRKDNLADMILHGTQMIGERANSAKLTEQDVRQIRALAGTMLHREIAAKFGIARSNVGHILSGNSWGWLQS